MQAFSSATGILFARENAMLKLQKRGRNGASQRAGEGRGERRKNGIKILLGVDPKKIRRVCMEFFYYNWATISETIIAPKCSFLASRPPSTLFFQNILTNPIISEISFL